jgi:hypothetical protein
MDSEIEDLRRKLREVMDLLSVSGERFWRDWLDSSLAHLERDPREGVEHLLKAYGGMGSFNDLVLEVADHQADARFDRLRTELYQLARDLHNKAKGGH